MPIEHDDIEQILRIVDGAPVGELMVRTERFTLHLVVGGPPAADDLRAGTETSVPPPLTAAAAVPGPPQPTAPVAATVQAAAGTETIEAPMLGTFYRAEAPGARPFVELGAEVEPDTIVCIIEVMKMMNSVPAGVSGRVVEVVAENGALVEFGQPLFRVEP